MLPRRPGPLSLLLALVAAVLAAGIVGLSVRGGNGTFSSSSLVTIDAPRAVAAAGDNGILQKLSGLRFKYAGLVPTDLLAVPVADRLKVPVEQVRGRLSASLQATDLLMRLTCRGTELAKTRTCAGALAQSLVDYVAKEQADNAIPVAQRIVVTQVQQPVFSIRVGANRSRTIGLASLAAVLAAAVVLGAAARPRR